MPGVFCQRSEVVLWCLFSIQIIFQWICGVESGLPVLFPCHLKTTPQQLYLGKIICTVGLPQWLHSKEFACNAGDLGSIPVLWISPGGGHGNIFQYSCLEDPHEQRCLEGYSPRGSQKIRHEWTTKCMCTHTNMHCLPEIKETTRSFFNQGRFSLDQQRIAIQYLQSWGAMCKSPLGKGRRMLSQRGKGHWVRGL